MTNTAKMTLEKAEEYAAALQADYKFRYKWWLDNLAELRKMPTAFHFDEKTLKSVPFLECDFRTKLILSRYLTYPLARTRKKAVSGEVKSLPYNIGYRITNSSNYPFSYKVLAGELLVSNEAEVKGKKHLLHLETKVLKPKETDIFSRYEMSLLVLNPLCYGCGVNFEVRIRNTEFYIVAPSFSNTDDFNVTPVLDEDYELKDEFKDNLGIRIDASLKNWDALAYNKKEISSILASKLIQIHRSFKEKNIEIEGLDDKSYI